MIDLKSAKTLGLTVPPSMLDLADEVVEERFGCRSSEQRVPPSAAQNTVELGAVQLVRDIASTRSSDTDIGRRVIC